MSVVVVNNKMQPVSTVSTAPDYDSGTVARRPIYFKELGSFFESLRKEHGWTQSDAARFAKQKKLKGLTRNVILRLEAGQVKNLESDVLKAVAALYEKPYEMVVGSYVQHRYGISGDLVGHAADQRSGSSQGGSDVPASTDTLARLLEVERERDEYLALFNRMSDAASKLISITVAARRAKGRATLPTQSGRGRRDRKAG